jgi:hypothetical protein
MNYFFTRKKLFSSLRGKQSEFSFIALSFTTSSDQKPREKKNISYKHARYELLLKIKNIFMDEPDSGITDKSKETYQILLNADQMILKNSLFRDDLFKSICRKIHNKNEIKVIRDISLLIVSFAETLITYNINYFEILIESINENWNNSIFIIKSRPQPDYSVEFKREIFTDD